MLNTHTHGDLRIIKSVLIMRVIKKGSQPVISPRGYVYVTMVRERMLGYCSEIICTAPAKEGNGEGPWEDCTKVKSEA